MSTGVLTVKSRGKKALSRQACDVCNRFDPSCLTSSDLSSWPTRKVRAGELNVRPAPSRVMERRYQTEDCFCSHCPPGKTKIPSVNRRRHFETRHPEVVGQLGGKQALLDRLKRPNAPGGFCSSDAKELSPAELDVIGQHLHFKFYCRCCFVLGSDYKRLESHVIDRHLASHLQYMTKYVISGCKTVATTTTTTTTRKKRGPYRKSAKKRKMQ